MGLSPTQMLGNTVLINTSGTGYMPTLDTMAIRVKLAIS